jgi:uncharacterized protein with HEPN domain
VSSDEVRVRHMLDAARQALEFVHGRDRPDLDSDPMLRLAVIKLLEIIGEAAKNVSEGTRALADIPWREISGTRDRLAHGYFDVNLDIVWDILTLDLPSVLPELEVLLARLESPQTD